MTGILKKERLEVIDAIRGFASLAVCLFHFTKCNLSFTGSSAYFKYIFSYGWVGVEAFFVVSGFIIPFNLYINRYKFADFFRFLLRRYVRIEPPFLFSIVLVILLNYLSWLMPLFKGSKPSYDINVILCHLFYLPEHFGYKWIQVVYWTLQVEIHFYILIGLMYAGIWKNSFTFICSFVLLLLLSSIDYLNLFVYLPFFIMGMLVCANVTGLIKHHYLYMGLLICSILLFLRSKDAPIAIITGIITSILIDRAQINHFVTNFLGKISFSLYLIHIPVGCKLLNLLSRYSSTSSQSWLAIISALAITILFAWFFNKLVEQPFLSLSKKMIYHKK